ncbi:hypothetical protein [Luteimonas sp. MC1750]|uniref:hypothetical protein n=1 Tax=Luteimonas sp. MC1750 TaxID=2799326 RepID=UPI0018F07AA4|nr:hypothetical protein [Luteimonas sp. MC1750]MBJ6983978.1 hypothetical protein [Luteimonas sp. MC1750]QQO06790.1 hypothetical protein JGR68_05030 [Luteimonas sp. MC1750]
MGLSLQDLQNLANLNPYRWHQLSQDQLDQRVSRSGLVLSCRPLAVDHRRPAIGKSVVTRAVLQRIAENDTDLAVELDDIRYAPRPVLLQDDWEREVFERLELLVEQMVAAMTHRRGALSKIAQCVRGKPIRTTPSLPFM